MRIAIIGGGISGLTAGYLLSGEHEVVLYEAGDYLGGHTNTVEVTAGDRSYAVDTGFIVFNEATYPNFIKLLGRLGVTSQPSDMSFSVSCERSGYEYSGSSLDTFFAQRYNLLRVGAYRLLLDIARFNRRSKALLAGAPRPAMNMASYCEALRMSREFMDYYLRPMMAAVWSADPAHVGQFPAAHFLQFFANHGLLDLVGRPTWRVIQGGSRSYVAPLAAPFREGVRLKTPVARVERRREGVVVRDFQGHADTFEHVLFATHSDQALQLLDAPTVAEREVLGAIRYETNDVVLHTDTWLLPRNRRAWASWNYRLPTEPSARATVTYNMNRLQGIQAPETFCVTLNQCESIDPKRVLRRFRYAHPQLDAPAIAAQARHREISGADRIHYCGAYWGYGFHEDGVKSALTACAPFRTPAL